LVVCFLAMAATILSPATAADRGELCPALPDARRAVTLNGVEVTAPTSNEAESAALAKLDAENRDERRRAAISLGLGGNLPAFRQLLEARDHQGLVIYARSYLPSDVSTCVAPEIEDALLAHMDDPALRPAMLAFLGQNLYTRRELFDRLMRIELEDGKPDDFVHVVRALTATRLEGVEGEVLAQAEGYLGHDTPLLKRVLPAVHRTYVAYFAERRYLPSIDYMERLLRAEGYGETLDGFIAEFSVTRSTVYNALGLFPCSEVGDVFTRQLVRVVRECPTRLVSYELSAFGASAVRCAHTDVQRRQVAESLAALLGHDPQSATEQHVSRPDIDYQRHRKVVELLADLGTTEAAAILVRELHALGGHADRSTDAMITHTLQALARIPSSADLDVPGFLQAANELPMDDQLHLVPPVLDAHPDPAAHGYYLAQMGWIVNNWQDLQARYHVDPERALWGVLERLMVLDEPEQLAATRGEVDRLFLTGLLDERMFLAASEAVNELTGDRSPVYDQLMERRRGALKAEADQKRAKARAEALRVVDENTSAEGIRRNLELLGESGSGSRRAASWLVIAGPDILSQAHERLADPAISGEHEFRLMQVLGEIGDPSSVEPMIDAVRGNTGNRALLRSGLRALGLMPPSRASFEFAQELLEGDCSVDARQGALIYLASVRDQRAAAIAEEYSAATVEPGVRVAALLLAARLGQTEVRPSIVELLETTEDRSHGEVLMRALGELTTPSGMHELAEKIPLHRDRPYFREVYLVVEFRHAEGDRRVELARRLIEEGHPWDRREAVASLVEQGPTEVLIEYLQLHPAMGLPLERSVVHTSNGVPILAQIRRMGYGIRETPDGFELEKASAWHRAHPSP
jgi:hypothetical protein